MALSSSVAMSAIAEVNNSLFSYPSCCESDVLTFSSPNVSHDLRKHERRRRRSGFNRQEMMMSCHASSSFFSAPSFFPSSSPSSSSSSPLCVSSLGRGGSPLTRLMPRTHSPDVAAATAAAGALARAEPVSTPEVERLLESIKWDSKGLVVAIAQHIDTGAVLMQGFANRDAISATVAARRATFFSRSRSSLWTKGESSRNFINVVDIYLDCDRDSIIYLGVPDGPTCHTGAETCYYTSASNFDSHDTQALTTLYALEDTIAQRKADTSPKPSWTKKLVERPDLLCSKIREEADELCRTVENQEGRERTISEMADTLYHSMVLLAVQGVKMEEVLEVLRRRFSKSGIEEKANRSSKS